MHLELRHYVDASGRAVLQHWLDRVRDLRGRIAILRRIDRLQDHQPGDHAYCRDGVWELRIHEGPGYRVYYAREGDSIVVLLGGGDKGSQRSDIDRAVSSWRDYRRRSRP